MAQLRLGRPLGIGGVFAHTFIVYGRRFVSMMMITLAFLMIPIVLILTGDCGVDPVAMEVTTQGVCGNTLGLIGVFGFLGLIPVAGITAILEAVGAYANLPASWRNATRVGIHKILLLLAAIILIGLLWAVPGIIPSVLVSSPSDGFVKFLGFGEYHLDDLFSSLLALVRRIADG